MRINQNWPLGAMRFGISAFIAWAATGPAAADGNEIAFRMHRIANVRSEAVDVADINGDGRKDIVAGNFWYTAPDWKPHKFRSLTGSVDSLGKGYLNDFMDTPLDVDGDGKLDIVTNMWEGSRIEWYRNPGSLDVPWDRTVADDKSGEQECGELHDIDGDGKALEILPHTAATMWYEAGTLGNGQRGLVQHIVSNEVLQWGGGVGDINGDGRPDIVRPNAWFEAPADPRNGVWIRHVLAIGGVDGLNPDKATWRCPQCQFLGTNEAGQYDHTSRIWVYDVDADGLADLVVTSAHNYGVFWYKQVRVNGVISFRQNIIDMSWTQAHNLTLADLDGDGDLDIITGKRFMAHNGQSDPEEYAPLGLYWYELVRLPTVKYIKHVISFNQGIGAGMNIVAEDMDGDGDLDIVVTGKYGGPVYFESLLKDHQVAIAIGMRAVTAPPALRYRLGYLDGRLRIIAGKTADADRTWSLMRPDLQGRVR